MIGCHGSYAIILSFTAQSSLAGLAGSFLSNTFMKNTGTNGGAIWHNNMQTLNHTLNLFVSNSGKNGSGGIELNQVNSMSVNSCNFTGGKGSKGGAIYTQASACSPAPTESLPNLLPTMPAPATTDLASHLLLAA